jgi:hypothetical protein
MQSAAEERAKEVTLHLPARGNLAAYGIDVLDGYRQRLVVQQDLGDMVVAGLLLTDYPRFVHLTPVHIAFLPQIRRKPSIATSHTKSGYSVRQHRRPETFSPIIRDAPAV